MKKLKRLIQILCCLVATKVVYASYAVAVIAERGTGRCDMCFLITLKYTLPLFVSFMLSMSAIVLSLEKSKPAFLCVAVSTIINCFLYFLDGDNMDLLRKPLFQLGIIHLITILLYFAAPTLLKWTYSLFFSPEERR